MCLSILSLNLITHARAFQTFGRKFLEIQLIFSDIFIPGHLVGEGGLLRGGEIHSLTEIIRVEIGMQLERFWKDTKTELRKDVVFGAEPTCLAFPDLPLMDVRPWASHLVLLQPQFPLLECVLITAALQGCRWD